MRSGMMIGYSHKKTVLLIPVLIKFCPSINNQNIRNETAKPYLTLLDFSYKAAHKIMFTNLKPEILRS